MSAEARALRKKPRITPPPTPRDVANPDMRDQILAAAAALFGERGYHATTVRDVAHGLGLLSGSLYSHVDSKEDLLYEITRLDMEIYLKTVVPIANSDAPAVERYRSAMRAHFKLGAGYGVQARIVLAEFREIKDEDKLDDIIDLRDRYDQLWDQIIADGIDQGAIRQDIDAKFFRIASLSIGNWASSWVNPDGPSDTDAIADIFCDLLLDGARSRE
ncbi:TetR/AcrR family transcriptional regulator [Nocardia sp. NPDC055049]